MLAMLTLCWWCSGTLTSELHNPPTRALQPAVDRVWHAIRISATLRTPNPKLLTEAMVEQGPDIIPALTDVWLGRDEPIYSDQLSLSDRERALHRAVIRDALRDALKQLPERPLANYLETLRGEMQGPARLAMIQLIEAAGGASSLPVLLALAEPQVRGIPEAMFWRELIEKTLTTLVHRDSHTIAQLSEHWHALPSWLWRRAAAIAIECSPTRGFDLLAERIGRDHSQDLALLETLTRHRPGGDLERRDRAIELARAAAFSDRRELRPVGLRSLGELAAVADIPRLIDLAEGDDASLRDAARDALRRLRNVRSTKPLNDWRRWWRNERAWHDDAAPTFLSQLNSSDSDEIVEGLLGLSTHPWARDLWLPQLRRSLRHHDGLVRRVAASAAGRLGQADAQPWLIERLEDDDSRTRHVAWTSLRRLTGRDLTAFVSDWTY